jgi:phosphohistidine swiveling domain-containing protein
MITQHHTYNLAGLVPTGDLIVHVRRWSGGKVADGEVCALLAGASPVSADLRSPEARALGAAVAADPAARRMLRLEDKHAGLDDEAAAAALAELRALPGAAGERVRAFLAHRELRLVDGLDLAAPCLRECPSLLWDALRSAALARVNAADGALDAEALARVRAAVPAAHHAELDSMIAEARAVAGLRDERALYSDVWAWGIVRTVVLAIGRRLIARDRSLLVQPEDLIHASTAEIDALLAGRPGPSATELERRAAYVRAYTTRDAPPTLGPAASPPPDPALLPPGVARVMTATLAVIELLFKTRKAAASADALHGFPASSGKWEGPVHLVNSHDDARDIAPGSVLVVGAGSSAFNMVAPFASAVVAEGGGLLSHVAIVCREYRIPCVCGCPGALSTLQPGQRVRVDGTRGVVELLAAA